MMWNGGALATAGDLVFQGAADGVFSAYAAASGERLWRFDAGLGIIAAPISYRAGGRQLISILAGYGGATPIWSSIMHRGWKFGRQPRRLLTFELNGKASLPTTPPADFSVQPLDDPAVEIDEHRAKDGATLYAARCMMCHGGALLSAGLAPDLRESRVALSVEAMKPIVREGALLSGGMPRFADLSDEDLTSLYMYIRAGAREALANASHRT
jgi:quinohemoprotein ethanol dehydrogenase